MSKYLKLFTNQVFVTILWFGLSFFAVLKQVLHHHYNNYLIYKYTFIDLVHQINLYAPQPRYFDDSNHYGPLFGLVIAPFTLLPDQLGCIAWVMVNAWVLYKAISMLPVTTWQRNAILLICAHELMTASYNVQFNPMMTAIIVLSFGFIRSGREFWAAALIVAGTCIKLYGVVGLAFFFFTDNKMRFLLSLAFWSVVLVLLPMVFSAPSFVMQSYYDWYVSLSEKNAVNTTSHMQDISVMGMIRRIFHYPQLSNLLVLLPGLALFGLQYLNIKSYKALPYQMLILASTLLFTVIFSTGSESPTYIIAFVGVAIWYMNLERPTVSGFDIALLVLALVITSLSPSDLFPQPINRAYIKPYALKALPCLLIWLKIVYETLTRKFYRPPVHAVE